MNETHVEPSVAKKLDYAGPDVPDPAPPEGRAAEREAGMSNALSSIDPSVIEIVPPAVEAGTEVVSAMIDSSAEIAGDIFDAIVGSIG